VGYSGAFSEKISEEVGYRSCSSVADLKDRVDRNGSRLNLFKTTA
jgi:hypothetical protein